jgi:Protein of unknown function (DUF4079)
MQTANGRDTANLRWQNKGRSGLQVQVDADALSCCIDTSATNASNLVLCIYADLVQCPPTLPAPMKTLLVYLHPVLQVLVLLVAFATLRLGLALKKNRRRERLLRNRRELFQRHTQLGSIFLGSLIGGYLLGIVSMTWFRQRPPFQSAHFFFATIALLLFLGGGYTGWRLKQGTKKYADVRDIHGFLMYLGLFVALGVGVMGFILLP